MTRLFRSWHRATALRLMLAVVMAVAIVAAGPVSAAGKRVAAVQSTLYFGLSTPNGKGISEQQWTRFLAEVVTPRFPDGLTVFTAYGQGATNPSHPTGETTKVLLIVHPDTRAAIGRVDKIAGEFRRRFGQTPFRTEQRVTIVE